MKLPFFATKDKGKKKGKKEKQVEEKAKRAETEGSRWMAVILLLVTMILGMLFYVKGQLSSENSSWFEDWSFSSEYVFE